MSMDVGTLCHVKIAGLAVFFAALQYLYILDHLGQLSTEL